MLKTFSIFNDSNSPTMPFQIHIGMNIDHHDQFSTRSSFKAYNKENIKRDVKMMNLDALKS